MSNRTVVFRPGLKPFFTIAPNEVHQSVRCFLLLSHLARPSRLPPLPGAASAVLASCFTERAVLVFFIIILCLSRRLGFCFCWQSPWGNAANEYQRDALLGSVSRFFSRGG